MSSDAYEIATRLARDLAPERMEDPEVKRWLETASRALETVLAQQHPIDGAEPMEE